MIWDTCFRRPSLRPVTAGAERFAVRSGGSLGVRYIVRVILGCVVLTAVGPAGARTGSEPLEGASVSETATSRRGEAYGDLMGALFALRRGEVG